MLDHPGMLVLVVGPSGAGKDSLIDHARQVFGKAVAFPRRVVTRASDAAEDHESLAPAAFWEAAARSAFAFCWQAHGLDYALPASVDVDLREGRTVVCNVSRGIVQDLRRRYRRVTVLYVDAPLAVRMARIAGRARAGEAADRAKRSQPFLPSDADVVIDNGGDFATAAEAFVGALTNLRA